MRRFNRLLSVILAGALLISTVSCGKADPGDYEYGQSINQLIDDEAFIAGNGSGSGSGDNPGSGSGDNSELKVGVTAIPMDEWIEKLEAAEAPEKYADTENKKFEDYLDQLFKDKVESDTITYNYTVKNGDVYGVKAPSPATLGDAESFDYYKEAAKASRESYDELMAFEKEPLTEKEYIAFLALKADYELSIYHNEHIEFDEPFAPMRGFQSNIGTNLAEWRFDDKQDVEDLIAVENLLPEYVKGLCEFEDERVKKGYGMQDNTCDEVIEQCETFAEDPENHFLISEFDSKVDKLDFLTEEEKKDYKEQNKKAVMESVIPCILQIRDCVKANKGKATVTGGLAQYEGGKDYYDNYIIPFYGGCNFTGDQLIEIYEKRYEKDYSILLGLYTKNPEAYNYLVENEQSLYADTDSKSAEEIIDTLMEKTLDEYPKLDKIPYKADYLSPAMEKIMDNTLAYYMNPPRDDKEGNIIRVNGATTNDMWITLAHEGCPGHMYQNTYFMTTNPSPIRADAYNLGYMEGWAVYSSYRTMANYDYQNTDDDEFIAGLAKIDKELGYMVYGRIDLGINYEGWSMDDLKNYMMKNGFNVEYAQEIYDTLLGDPGVYLSYSFSQFMVEGFRAWAEEKLGDEFDPVEFHKAFLDCGPCQFEVVKFKMNEYVNGH